MRLVVILALLLTASGCATPDQRPAGPVRVASPVQERARVAAATFVQVVRAVEPVAESLCRARGVVRACDFRIVVDDRPGQPPNAFQTLDNRGRPVIGFTLALIADARNGDELAFVLGHEAAHHIAGHLPRQRERALSGGLLAGVLAQANGLDPEAVKKAANLGAALAIHTYSREFELEADTLGAEIAFLAGYDPVRGSGFFDRLPDPGNRFLSSHPPNAVRKAQVAATVRRLAGN